jgi:PAS domain S-box-containing protein
MPSRGDLVAALDRLPVPVFTVRLDGTISWLNRAGRAELGDVAGRRYTMLIAPESQRTVQDYFARRVHGDRSPLEYEAVLLRPDGGRTVVEISTVPLEDDGHVIGVFGIFIPERELPPVGNDDPELTPRQLEVLRHLAMGASTGQIADRLGISIQTVRNHVRDLLRGLGVHSRLEAVLEGHRRGLV